jgi:hypothetical protein
LVLQPPWRGSWRDNQADNRDKGSGTWLVTGDQADDHQLDAAAWLGEATLVLDGIFGGLRDVRFGSKADIEPVNWDVRFTPESEH